MANHFSLPCTVSSFPDLSFFGVKVVSLTTSLAQNYTASSPPFLNPNHGFIPPATLDFCNLTITHTHPGQNDAIITQIWLPTKTWNGRLQSIGGGGFIAGLYGYMFVAMDAAIAEGYAAASTNSGVYATDINGGDADEWALLSPGNADLNMIRNFAEMGQRDMTLLAKKAIKSFYGEDPRFSYWSGCSAGGRQAYILAQKYPGFYDGIAACAPGIYTDEWVENYWAQQLMGERGEFPWPCELDALSKAAVEACDEIDGVKDGILNEPDKCELDPKSLIGTSIQCAGAGRDIEISRTAAAIADGIWKGRRQDGIEFQGETGGYDVDLKLAGATKCSNGACVPSPDPLTLNWLRIFVQKDPEWRPSTNMSRTEFEQMRRLSVREYRNLFGVSDYDLSGFHDAGGKMLTYQGTADAAISYKNTRRFYDAVAARDPSVQSYYRLFLAPGLGHGVGGRGAYPHTAFHTLVDWVEKGRTPESLEATSAPDKNGESINRTLCAYPMHAELFKFGNANDFKSWKCIY